MGNETGEARAARMLQVERRLWRAPSAVLAGVDEVGLGPLAGPVVAAAVVLPRTVGAQLVHLNDSKKVSAKRRAALVPLIEQLAVAWALGSASAAEVDALNVYQAARLAAARAVAGCARMLAVRGAAPISHLLLDAHPLPQVALPQVCLVRGDGASQSIAAASVLAKEARDATMAALAVRHPGYGFERHAGYPTAAHLAALAALGPSPVHRQSYAPVIRAAGGAAPPAQGSCRSPKQKRSKVLSG